MYIKKNKIKITDISGGISGAIIYIDSKKANSHAIKRYGAIRKSKNDIENIVKNTKFSFDQINLVKKIFIL